MWNYPEQATTEYGAAQALLQLGHAPRLPPIRATQQPSSATTGHPRPILLHPPLTATACYCPFEPILPSPRIEPQSMLQQQSPPPLRPSRLKIQRPRWTANERFKLFMAVVEDKQLDDMTTFAWDRIATRVGRSKKACKDQWRREILKSLIHHFESEVTNTTTTTSSMRRPSAPEEDDDDEEDDESIETLTASEAEMMDTL